VAFSGRAVTNHAGLSALDIQIRYLRVSHLNEPVSHYSYRRAAKTAPSQTPK
jgi:hypothetical protein